MFSWFFEFYQVIN